MTLVGSLLCFDSVARSGTELEGNHRKHSQITANMSKGKWSSPVDRVESDSVRLQTIPESARRQREREIKRELLQDADMYMH
jgi:hypothetical protein